MTQYSDESALVAVLAQKQAAKEEAIITEALKMDMTAIKLQLAAGARLEVVKTRQLVGGMPAWVITEVKLLKED